MSKTVKLTIYLVKDKQAKASDIIETEDAKEPIELEMSNASCTLYIRNQKENSPAWASLLTNTGQVAKEDFGVSKGTGAALIIRLSEASFLITLGQGFHLLNDDAIERDFGLRVALNSIATGDIHSLDKATDERTPINSRTQSGLGVDLFEMLVDPNKDMLYAITGKSAESMFGASVTGRDSLQIKVKVELNGFSDILRKALVQYQSPLPNEFKWVDNIRRIKDPSLVQSLDNELIQQLNAGKSQKLWMAEPEIVDFTKIDGYSMGNSRGRYQFLCIERLRSHLLSSANSITLESLKGCLVYARDEDHNLYTNWTSYRCLNAEVNLQGETFILRNAIWYRIDDHFIKSIDAELAKIPIFSEKLPDFNHKNEGEYNEEVATLAGFVLMDKKMIPVGTGSSKVEFCDLIKDQYKLIHVKKYSSSSTLSHLFSQGLVSAEAFKSSEDFRKELNKKLPANSKLLSTADTPDSASYEVVYAIYTDKNLPLELPFFSKVTLKNAYQNLRKMDYNVSISKIDIDRGTLVRGVGKVGSAPKKRKSTQTTVKKKTVSA